MNNLKSTIILTLFPIGIAVISFLDSPDYFGPLLQRPIGIAVCVFALLWLGLGAFLLLITGGFIRALVILLFPIAVTVCVILAPACLTIVQALGPIM